MAHACNSSTQQAGAEDCEFSGQSELHSKGLSWNKRTLLHRQILYFLAQLTSFEPNSFWPKVKGMHLVYFFLAGNIPWWHTSQDITWWEPGSTQNAFLFLHFFLSYCLEFIPCFISHLFLKIILSYGVCACVLKIIHPLYMIHAQEYLFWFPVFSQCFFPRLFVFPWPPSTILHLLASFFLLF